MVHVVYNTYPLWWFWMCSVYETFCMISFSVHNCCLIWSLLLIKDVACVQAQRKLFKIAWEGKSWIEQGFISLFYFDKWCACRKWNFGGEKNRGNSNPPASPDQHSNCTRGHVLPISKSIFVKQGYFFLLFKEDERGLWNSWKNSQAAQKRLCYFSFGLCLYLISGCF